MEFTKVRLTFSLAHKHVRSVVSVKTHFTQPMPQSPIPSDDIHKHCEKRNQIVANYVI